PGLGLRHRRARALRHPGARSDADLDDDRDRDRRFAARRHRLAAPVRDRDELLLRLPRRRPARDPVPEVRSAPADLGPCRAPAAARIALRRLGFQRLAPPREPAYSGQAPVRLAPDIGLDDEVVLVDFVDVEAARLAAAFGTRLAESGCDRDRRPPQIAGGDL